MGKVVHVSSSAPHTNVETFAEQSISMSHQDRMKLYEKDLSDVAEKEKQRIAKHKEERGGYAGIQVSAEQKERAKKLLLEHVEKQKKGDVAAGASASKGKILKEALKNPPKPEQSTEIIQQLGLFTAMPKTPKFGKNREENVKEEDAMSVLNMNNNAMMNKMTENEKENMQNIVCDALIKTEELKQVQMCNAGLDDTFLTKILDKLSKNKSEHNVTELWLESNPIGDEGMQALAEFMRNDDKICVVKLYNNKKTISTKVLEELLDALKENKTIVKFVFDGFRFIEQKDKLSKCLRDNQDIARKKRNAERKRLKELGQ